MFNHKIVAFAFGGAVALSVMAPALPAVADASSDYTTNGVHIRSAATTTSTSKGLGYVGQKVAIKCAVGQGQSVGGNRYWVKARNRTTLVLGYSAATYIASPSSGTFPYYPNASSCSQT